MSTDKSHEACPFWRRPRVIACAGLVLLVCVVLIFSALRSKTPAQNTDKPALVTGSEEPTRAFSASTLPSDTGDPTLHEIVSTQGETKPYTVMVYMVGSNLESRFGAATDDIYEMRDAGIDFAHTNLVVCTGGSQRWNSNVSAKQTSILDLSREESDQLVAATNGTSDMATPEMLSSFITYAQEHYPAEHYALILWDHGGGPLYGYGSDELYRGDTLTLDEMRQAMEKTAFATDNKLDWVGFDACLMATMENASLWSQYADYLVGSEEVEAGSGWDYSFLATLNETDDARTIATAAVDAYGQYYKHAATENFNPDATLSVLDLSKVDRVTRALDDLADSVTPMMQTTSSFAHIAQLRESTKAFGVSEGEGKGSGYDLIDLNDLAGQLGELDAKSADKLTAALDEFVVTQTSNVADTGGVSIYFPGDNSELFARAGTSYEDVAPSDGYQDLLNAYTREWLSEEGQLTDVWELADTTQSKDEVRLQLTNTQQTQAVSAHYNILSDAGSAGYQPVLLHVEAAIDADGVVHAPLDPLLVVLQVGTSDSGVPAICYQTEGDNREGRLRSGVELFAGLEFEDDFDTAQLAVVTLQTTASRDEVRVKDIRAEEGLTNQAGKASVDISRYKSIMYNLSGTRAVSTNAATGELLPFEQWKDSGTITAFYEPVDQSLSYVRRPLSSFTDTTFYVQLTVTDANGVQHAAGLFELPKAQEKTTTVATPKGVLTFALKDASAELISYEGTDTTLTLPDRVAELPLTTLDSFGKEKNDTVERVVVPEGVSDIADNAATSLQALKAIELPKSLRTIGNDAFSYCTDLSELEIPDGVTSIGRAAFAGTAIDHLAIPSSLTFLGEGAFTNMNELVAFSQQGSNKLTTVHDGVLFSADETTLLAYPAQGPASYDVPSGTTTIAYGACANCPLTHIGLPKGLVTIDNYAFYGCSALQSLELPASLERVGTAAFGKSILSGPTDELPHFEELRIGAKLVDIGPRAFTGLRFDAYRVSSKNTAYSSHNGLLLSKAGDTLISVPLGAYPLIVIPDGVARIEETAVADLPVDADYVLPNSLYRIPEDIFPHTFDSSSSPVYSCVFHCEEGSAAETYAQRFGIPYDHISDPKRLAYTTTTAHVSGISLDFKVYNDHAELVASSFDSRDEGDVFSSDTSSSDAPDEDTSRFVLPSEVDGVPVTRIALTGTLEIPFGAQSVILPDDLEEIRIQAEGVSSVGGLIAAVQNYEISPDNQHFKTVDGVLYSKDATTLVAFPGARDGSYTVPDGTQTIGSGAFKYARVQSVVLPSSLTSIDAAAFTSSSLTEVQLNKGLTTIGDAAFRSTKLTSCALPEGLQTIGSYAFSELEGYKGLALPDSVVSIGSYAFSHDTAFSDEKLVEEPPSSLVLPQGLETFDGTSFAGLALSSFTVDEGNTAFRTEDGMVLSADGTHLIACGSGMTGDIHVPQGVQTIDAYAFKGNTGITDVWLPSSLEHISSIAFELGTVDQIVFHGQSDSEAEHLIVGGGYSWVPTDDQ